MTEAAVEAGLRASDATVAWCLRHASRRERLGELEQAAIWAHVAARTAVKFGHSWLSSAPLESILVRLGVRLPHVSGARAGGATSADRWLHVFSMSYEIGGHTAIARRWIARNPFGQRHSVLLTTQSDAAIDPGLARAVLTSGGEIHSVAGIGSLLERAAALRRLARDTADVVVLHTHEEDVVPSLAFAAPGGPPVLLINHADHTFWVGLAVSDMIVDIRDSGLALSTSFRGARGSALLPVPLEDRGPAPRDRSVAAARMSDPSPLNRALVLLTVGRSHKFLPQARLDFPACGMRIVDALGDCALIVVGAVPEDPLWRRAAEQSGGRVIAVETDPDLAPWHAAADIYLEGFPIGSYTALLEAALAARPFVRKPHLMSPSVLPVDRGALGAFEPPADMDAYVAAAIALAQRADGRDARADEGRRAVLAFHCGPDWDARLDALQRAIPADHGVGFGAERSPMPAELARYWARIRRAESGDDPLGYAQKSVLEHGLNWRIDVELLEGMRARSG
jgi:hypothetical protein